MGRCGGMTFRRRRQTDGMSALSSRADGSHNEQIAVDSQILELPGAEVGRDELGRWDWLAEFMRTLTA